MGPRRDRITPREDRAEEPGPDDLTPDAGEDSVESLPPPDNDAEGIEGTPAPDDEEETRPD